MGLLDGLTASGATPGQQFRASVFFHEHPGLDAEVRACRKAGFSWKQIAAQISADHQVRISPSAVAEFIERQA